MKYLARFIWSVATIVVAYLMLRLYTGVSRHDFGGMGYYIYLTLIAGYVVYSILFSRRAKIKWYQLLLSSIFLIFLVFLFFFLSFWFEW